MPVQVRGAGQGRSALRPAQRLAGEPQQEILRHQGRWWYGKTPMQTFNDSKRIAQEKVLVA
jgi:hypothetical protein